MPRPHKRETKNEFMQRCVQFLNDNDEYKNNQQRISICYSYWDEYQREQERSKSIFGRLAQLWKRNQE